MRLFPSCTPLGLYPICLRKENNIEPAIISIFNLLEETQLLVLVKGE